MAVLDFELADVGSLRWVATEATALGPGRFEVMQPVFILVALDLLADALQERTQHKRASIVHTLKVFFDLLNIPPVELQLTCRRFLRAHHLLVAVDFVVDFGQLRPLSDVLGLKSSDDDAQVDGQVPSRAVAANLRL